MGDAEQLRAEVERLRAENSALKRENEQLRAVEEENQKVRASLRESEGRYRSVVDALDDGVVLHDHDGKIVAWNASAERVLGLTADQLRGRTSLDPRWRCIHPDGSAFPGDQHPGRKSLETGETLRGVVMGVHKPDGELSWLSVNSRPVESPGGSGRYSVVASFCDITEQIVGRRELEHSEAQLRRMLREKETLLRELYHRTRNNMAVIRALIGLRTRSAKNPTVERVLSEMDDRIRAMELVQQKLYQSADLARIELSEYLSELMPLLRDSRGASARKVEFDYALLPVTVSIDVAMPLGLVAVELVTNAFKHAFPGDRQGTITVSLSQLAPSQLELAIADDGVGMNADADTADTLGLRTVARLVEHQLQGSLALENGNGLTARVRFDTSIYDTDVAP